MVLGRVLYGSAVIRASSPGRGSTYRSSVSSGSFSPEPSVLGASLGEVSRPCFDVRALRLCEHLSCLGRSQRLSDDYLEDGSGGRGFHYRPDSRCFKDLHSRRSVPKRRECV